MSGRRHRRSVKIITLVATTMATVKACPAQKDRDDRWVALMVADVGRAFGRPKEELVAQASELAPTLLEVLGADPAEMANFCGPMVKDEDEPKRQRWPCSH